MKSITLTLLLLGAVGFTTIANAQDDSSAVEEQTATEDKAATDKKRVTPEDVGSEEDESSKQDKSVKEDESSKQDKSVKEDESSKQDKSAKEGESSKQDKSAKQDEPSKKDDSSNDNKTAKDSGKGDANQAKDAYDRGTPPWTNDSANVNLQESRTPPDESKAEPYSKDDLTIQPEWKKFFPEKSGFSLDGGGGPAHFEATSGEELYQTLCQACHMPDGQGAEGAGIYPSFVGNERLRTPYYPIDVILNGFRGMQAFGDMLSNEQIANVVDYLRMNFGNQLEVDTTDDDVARVRHEP